MKLNLLNEQILDTVQKWGIIYQDDLISLLSKFDHDFKKSYTYIERLTKKGLIKKISDTKDSRKKIILPASVSDICNSENDISINANHHFHDSIVTSICLELSNFNSVADITTGLHCADTLSKKGDLVADAEIAIRNESKSGIFYTAIELELQQKNKFKISNKLLQYSSCKDFKYVIYFFPTRRMLVTYQLVLEKLIQDHASGDIKNFDKFIFLYRNDANLPLNKLTSYKIHSSDKERTFNLIFKQFAH